MTCLKSLLLLFTTITLTLGQNGTTAPLLEKEFEIKYFAKTSWFNAHLSCLACGGRLASIESEGEQKFVEGLIHNLGLQNVSFWTAGTDLVNEGIFNWFTTGDLIQYSNFQQGQPDNSGEVEHCLVLWGARELKWNDANCNNLAYFICENRPKCEL